MVCEYEHVIARTSSIPGRYYECSGVKLTKVCKEAVQFGEHRNECVRGSTSVQHIPHVTLKEVPEGVHKVPQLQWILGKFLQ